MGERKRRGRHEQNFVRSNGRTLGRARVIGIRERHRYHSLFRILDLRNRNRVPGGRLLSGKNSNDRMRLEIDRGQRTGRVDQLPEFLQLLRRGDEVVNARRYA